MPAWSGPESSEPPLPPQPAASEATTSASMASLIRFSFPAWGRHRSSGDALASRSQSAGTGLTAASWYVPDLTVTFVFRVLGPFEVHDGERQLALGGTRQRSVLALLLLHRGVTLSSDRLIDELWGERPPADAQTALQQHVSRLRKA